MVYRPLIFITGLVLSKMAVFMYFPMALAFYNGGLGGVEFLSAIIITHLASFIFIFLGGEENRSRLGVREMFLLTTGVWVLASLFAALPFVLIQHISYSDAFFETMSGITTTGSTVLHNLDTMHPSILLWRSILQWLGGVGFIVMGVAILPFLNVGGMRLFQTESSDWSDKAESKTRNVAIDILLVYLILTLCCFIGYRASGMSGFDALNHAMTTISTGGYSTSDGSMGHFSVGAHWNAIIFMFLGGLPFLLFIRAFNHRNFLYLINDAQVIGFIKVIVVCTASLTAYLTLTGQFSFSDAIRLSLFNVVSVLTTTGFGLDDFITWGDFSVMVFFGLLFFGACSGSTAGGMKIFRFQIAMSLLKRQLMLLMHPHGIFPQKYNNRTVSDEILRSLIAFVLAYLATIIVATLLLTLFGATSMVALTAAITAVSNVGPGLAPSIGPSGNFADFPDISKWILSVCMLMGRLEILTVVVLFTRHFWRR
ncbi:TrkH family potassium uptake protein [Psychromonas antarctica]|jgi:trk system potassium uptake protein TrkH|uniref:TrkH family potassium uptake protein n=1 Tax=Psychromonas antarctica TaxID=67573 RepID=UPI001EE83BB3|nr:TrkH family potassium uptake protein [Psychromonas antarctica]MCG6200713.1 TrkH family potassium uptake protein [Psychromonas antarctica]